MGGVWGVKNGSYPPYIRGIFGTQNRFKMRY